MALKGAEKYRRYRDLTVSVVYRIECAKGAPSPKQERYWLNRVKDAIDDFNAADKVASEGET